MAAVKTQKIATGYYKGIYKKIPFSITKVDISEVAWYWQIGDSSADDWHSSKKAAIYSVMDFIDWQSNRVKNKVKS